MNVNKFEMVKTIYIRKNKKKHSKNIFSCLVDTVVNQIKGNKINKMKIEFMKDINENRQCLIDSIIDLQKAKFTNDHEQINALEIKVCAINKQIIKDCEIFQAIFSYHPIRDMKPSAF